MIKLKINKTKLSRATEEQRNVFLSFVSPMIRFIGEMEATKEEIKNLYCYKKSIKKTNGYEIK